MSLTDKVIKNTYYFFISQVSGFILPLFLTPFIVSRLGQVQFGVYAIVLGFTGTFGLLDMSLSSSFLKFISEHFNKKETEELNYTINTGLFFYIIFSLIFCGIGFFFSKEFISLFNVPAEIKALSITAFRISLVIFFISNSFGIFNSVLISLQKMYLTSIISVITNVLNFILTILIVLYGYGLIGIMSVILFISTINILFSYTYAKKELPYLKIRISEFRLRSLKKMLRIGIQMQISKLSTFANEKYDEFLLGTMSILNNVTFYNIANRVNRYAGLFPMQLYQQGAPVAAELSAKEEKEKLILLLGDTTKYISILTAPIFIYIFVFSDILITSWLGSGYEISINILRILALGELINMIFSKPGNTIIPNIGVPKYQMHEGLICLALNVPLSFFLIKYFGVVGAAYGNTAAKIISSLYIFFTSVKFFEQKSYDFFKIFVLKPNISALISSIPLFLIYKLLSMNIYPLTDRYSAVLYLAGTGIIFFLTYIILVLKSRYFNERDKAIFLKIIFRILPLKRFT
jgi:O-antigen/teichoic acid export membrane protein